MVMEAPPSPQCVGREFVRQYYTLLNQAPAHLHRFYNNNSSFVHGGLDAPNRETKPVVGQKQIHQKIQQLNFRDCHAKISQVDSQATLGNGVVVQVTGELSNSGQPMRRFTQTFVLAAQSPKKYYVHNDIFRYQDMMFSDEEVEQDSGHSAAEEDAEAEHSPSAEAITPAPAPIQTAPAPMTVQPVHPAHEEEEEEEEAEVENPVEEEMEEEGDGWGETENGAEEDKEKPQQEIMEESHHLSESTSSEPKTYATLVKTGGIGGVGTASFASTMSTSPNAPAKPTTSPPPMVQRPMEQRDSMQLSNMQGGTAGGMAQGQRVARRGGAVRGMTPRPDRGGLARGNFTEDNANGDGDRRRMGPNIMQQYADAQQLFMGNLPHHATEEELKELFSKFGSIIDLRIHSKQNAKNVSGNRVPNYGFIIFEHASSVQQVLLRRPICFPDENGQKLNVEEKKIRPRSMDGGRMGSGGDTMQGGGRPTSGMGGPRGGGPGGMMRGGPGLGHHRGGGRGGFSRGEGRGGGMNRGSYTRR